ncbi:hypothetical protein CDL12_10080 [Handroanthus impetiginosus]|uniref:VQ domain-containing protein n=1 Tax=Handroanthus impetiginosus TaxID=429701 RepID=A0A2G9HID4_9LAMI|nr:hypothetical protein CDL12_10080 [Handroanthus impetiginosus]
MSDNLQNYSQIWGQDQYYHNLQPVGHDQFATFYQDFSDANIVSTNFHSKNSVVQDETALTNTNVIANMNGAISSPEIANPTTSPGKSKRWRSKGTSSKSTTFLNASVRNFRALVQQHTGCHTSNSSPKGPITLCFASSSSSHQDSVMAINSPQAQYQYFNRQYYH